MTAPDRGAAAQVRRALPRLAMVAAVVVLLLIRHDVVAIVAAALAAVYAVPRPSWWAYVRTGQWPWETGWLTGRTGDHRVVLEEPGTRKIQVIKQIREATGAPLLDAKRIVDAAPSTVADGLAGDAAQELVQRLTTAGAQARAQVDPAPAAG